MDQRWKLRWVWEKNASIFTAEIFTVKQCSDIMTGAKICIMSDSQEALKALEGDSFESLLLL